MSEAVQAQMSPLVGAIFTQIIKDEQHTANALMDSYRAMRNDMAQELVEVLDALAEIPPHAMSVTIHNVLVRTQWAYETAQKYLHGDDRS